MTHFPPASSMMTPFAARSPWEMSTSRQDPIALQSQIHALANMPEMCKFAPILSCDLIESSTDYHIHADLPGVVQGDIDISIDNKRLLIKAERRVVHEIDTDLVRMSIYISSITVVDIVKQVHRCERNFGKVERWFQLPSDCNTLNATAKFEHGVLCVSFPKTGAVGGGSRKLLL